MWGQRSDYQPPRGQKQSQSRISKAHQVVIEYAPAYGPVIMAHQMHFILSWQKYKFTYSSYMFYNLSIVTKTENGRIWIPRSQIWRLPTVFCVTKERRPNLICIPSVSSSIKQITTGKMKRWHRESILSLIRLWKIYNCNLKTFWTAILRWVWANVWSIYTFFL